MKILALSISLLGILILIIMLNLSNPIIVDNSSQLKDLQDYTKIQTQGKVISERTLYENTKLLILDNNIEIICNSCPSYINRTLHIIGTTETYINRTQVQALKIILQ